jgi:hypothetical protein
MLTLGWGIIECSLNGEFQPGIINNDLPSESFVLFIFH